MFFDKYLKEEEKGRKFKTFCFGALIALIVAVFIYAYSDANYDNYVRTLGRTMVLENGITFVAEPSYSEGQLRVKLKVTNGWARLFPDEQYDIHLVDADGFDVVSIYFKDKDFTWNTDNSHSAYKQVVLSKRYITKCKRLRMRYPAWVEDK